MSREKAVRWFSLTLIALFLLSMGWNVVSQGRVLDATLFTDEQDTGMDFYNSVTYVRGRVPYTQFDTVYPPLANALYLAVMHAVPNEISDTWGESYLDAIAHRMTASDLRLHQDTAFAFLVSLSLLAVLFFQLCYHSIGGGKVTRFLFSTAMLLSMGVLQAIERGNIILLAVCLVMFFLRFKDSRSRVLSELALVALAAAAGLKLYPAVFGLLLVLDRQYRRALRTLLYGLVLFFGPFFLFEGVAAIRTYFQQLAIFNDPGSGGSPIGLSMVQTAETLLRMLRVDLSHPALYPRLLAFAGTASAVAAVAAVGLCLVTKSRWKAITLLSLVTLLLPGRTAMYVLSMMTIALIAFFTDTARPDGWRKLYAALFLPVFAFFPYALRHVRGYQVVQPVIQFALIALFAVLVADILREGFARGRAQPGPTGTPAQA